MHVCVCMCVTKLDSFWQMFRGEFEGTRLELGRLLKFSRQE